jgi:NADH dehydrogenase
MTLNNENKLVTVFGGSGFVGHQVVRRLARDGFRVRVASRKPSHVLSLQPLGSVGQIALVRADIRNEAEVVRALEGAEAVVNLVGILKESGRRTFAAVHVQGAATVARCAARAGARRLVHVSAIGADAASRSAYARSKAEGERAVREAFPRATVLRPSIVFGAGDGFFNRFANLMRLSRVIFPLFGGGRTKFQPVFVGDVADAVVSAIADESAGGRIYELGGPAVYTFREILELISRVIERKRAFIPIPFFMLDLGAALTGWLPFAPVTLDQARLLRKDNIVKAGPDAANVGTLSDLGVRPTAVEAVVESYLYAYRPTGQYAEPRGA